MKKIFLLLACWPFRSTGRLVEESRDASEKQMLRPTGSPSQAVAMALLAYNPVGRFHLSGRGARTSLGNLAVASSARIAPTRQNRKGSLAMTSEDSEALEAAKQELDSALFTGNGFQPDSTMQAEVTECIEALTAVNPTSDPAYSILLNGKWEVVYAGAPGAGFFDTPTRPLALALYAAPFQPSVVAQGLAKLPFDAATLQSVYVSIQSTSRGQPRVSAEADINVMGGSSVTIKLNANLSPTSSIALREDFVEAEAFGQSALLPGPFALSRTLYIAYLDEDWLIVRDETGLPNVLKRMEKFPEATEPSYTEDDTAPGAG